MLKGSHAIKKTNSDKRQAEITRRLAVIPGEDPEPSRIDRQALVKPELGTEVGDQIAAGIDQCPDFRVDLLRQIGVIIGKHTAIILQVDEIVGRRFEFILRHPAQEYLQVMATGMPKIAVQMREQRPDRAVPAID